MKPTHNNKRAVLTQLIGDFYPYAREQLGFNKDCEIILVKDAANSENPFGKTAQYDIKGHKVVLYVDERHPKDIMRSLAHELVHHRQNCDGKFDNLMSTEEGYAQKNPCLRDMEKEAFLVGNMLFRDYEDMKKSLNNKLFEIRNKRLFSRLMQDQGLKERIQFDEADEYHLEPEEEIDPTLLNDIVEMFQAGEKEDEIEEMLIRGEGMDYPECRKYIYLAKKKGNNQ